MKGRPTNIREAVTAYETNGWHPNSQASEGEQNVRGEEAGAGECECSAKRLRVRGRERKAEGRRLGQG